MPHINAFIADPVYEGKRLHAHFGWSDPFTGVAQACRDLNVAFDSPGLYTLEPFEIPLPAFGFRNPDRARTHIDDINVGEPITLSPGEWVQKWETTGWNPQAWPGNGELHIRHFLQQHVLPRIGSCDEVWLAGMPMPMAFEGAMLAPTWDLAAPRLGVPWGPGPTLAIPVPCTLSLPAGLEHDEVSLDRLKAYQTHDTLVNVPGIDKRYVLHMFQSSNFQPLHCYIHRAEAVLNYIFNGTGWAGYSEQWSEPLSPMNLRSYIELFGMTENASRGRINAVGSGHFHCNSKIGYLYQMADVVPSIAHLFKDFPNGFPIDLSTVNQRSKLVSAKDWAHFRDAQMWWLSCLPRNPGMTNGRLDDWSAYVKDVNLETGRNEPLTRPVVGSLPMLPGAVTRHGNRALLRWEPDPGDPGEVMYRLSVDGVDAGSLRRVNQHHVRLSADVPLGRDYRIKADYPGGRERIFNVNVPTPDDVPPIEPEEPMPSLEDITAIVDTIHGPGGELAGCPKPERYAEEGIWVRAWWDSIMGGTNIPMAKIMRPDEIKSGYIRMFHNQPGLDEACGQVVPPPEPTPVPEPDPAPTPTPVPTPTPQPTPTISLRPLLEAEIAGYEAHAAKLREHLGRLS